MKRWISVFAVLVLPQFLQAAQWKATVGADSNDQGIQALAFLPNEMWIHEGDSIVWTFVTNEIHTVTFLTDGHPRLPFPVGCPGFTPSPATFTGANCVTTPPNVPIVIRTELSGSQRPIPFSAFPTSVWMRLVKSKEQLRTTTTAPCLLGRD